MTDLNQKLKELQELQTPNMRTSENSNAFGHLSSNGFKYFLDT